MLYRGEGDIETVKGKVLEWLRQFVAWKNLPTKQKYITWLLEKFCDKLNNASSDGEKLAKAFAAAIKENARDKKDVYNYDEELLNLEELSKDELLAQNFQKCTELAQDNCAKGVNNDPFFEQCKNPDHIKKMCINQLGSMGYDPDNENSKLQLDFISKKFGFDFGQLKNVLFTSGELDQYAIPKDLIKSDASRKVYVFPSIGLSARGHELDEPNVCDSLAIKQAWAQISDLLECAFFPSLDQCRRNENSCPYPLDESNRVSDAAAHEGMGVCRSDLSCYYAEYRNGATGFQSLKNSVEIMGILLILMILSLSLAAIIAY